jgi:hypothetical protein
MIGAQEAPVDRLAEALQEVTLEDLAGLLRAGVEITDLLSYAQAIASNRLN